MNKSRPESHWSNVELKTAEDIAESLNYRHNGLLIVVAQDVYTEEVLMVAFANKDAVVRTLTTGKVHYWSTSRKKLWLKGEKSGHFQKVEKAYVDCDADTLLLKVHQIGNACHTGHKSCFYRIIKRDEIIVEKLKNE